MSRAAAGRPHRRHHGTRPPATVTGAHHRRLAAGLSAAVVLLAFAASAAGLIAEGLYRDNVWVASQLRGSDAVRLIVILPTFVTALVLARRGSLRAELVWLGMAWLTLYDYAFYLLGTTFNELFLVYAALVALPLLVLGLTLPHVDVTAVRLSFRPETPARPVAAYLLGVAAFLGLAWTAQSLAFVVAGILPQTIQDSGHPTNVVFALDLALLVPALAAAGVGLWRERPWGFVLASVMLVKGALYPLALLGMALFHARATGAWDPMALLWLVFAVVGATAAIAFYRGMSPRRRRGLA